MHDGSMWMFGMGWVGVLFWLALILAIAALIKCLISR